MFIHGYVTGIAAHPDVVPFGQWFERLFGNIHFIVESHQQLMDSFMSMYNELMLQITDGKFKLPAKCKLSKTNYQASLKKGEPLPEWCAGMLAGLKFIDKRSLTKLQKQELKNCEEMVKAFTSLKHAEKAFTNPHQSFEESLHEAKRGMSTIIHNTIFELRFFNPKSSSFHGDIMDYSADIDEFFDEELDSEMSDELEELLASFEAEFDFAMFEENKEAEKVRNDMIVSFENMMGKSWFEQNKGHFWGLHETRPYMMLRARRAELNARKGNFADAIAELNELMLLNPMDNQANRYLLANCLATKHRWQELKELLEEMEKMGEYSTFYLASRALMLFALEGGSSSANEAKKQLLNSNKHLLAYLTGQKKSPSESPEMYSMGSKEEAIIYIFCRGKEAWRAVDGSLFWLREK